MFDRFAIELLQMPQAVKGATTILRLHWDATWNILNNSTVETIEEGPDRFHIMKMANDAVDKVRRG
jgi:hypothetical protein